MRPDTPDVRYVVTLHNLFMTDDRHDPNRDARRAPCWEAWGHPFIVDFTSVQRAAEYAGRYGAIVRVVVDGRLV